MPARIRRTHDPWHRTMDRIGHTMPGFRAAHVARVSGAGVFAAVPLGRGVRSEPRAGSPAPVKSMAKAKTKTTTQPPVTPTLDAPLTPETPAGTDATPQTPYDRALVAGEELRRKPYEAATPIQ